MKTWLKRIFISILLVFIVSTSLLSFILTTTPGLYTLIKVTGYFLPGSIKLHHVRGRLISGISIGELKYKTTNSVIIGRHISAQWHIQSWIKPFILVNDIRVQEIKKGSVQSIPILHNLSTHGSVTNKKLELKDIAFESHGVNILGSLKLMLQQDPQIDAYFKSIPTEHIQGSINLAGKWSDLHWTGHLSGPVDCSIEGSLIKGNKISQTIKWRNASWSIDKNTSIHSPLGNLSIKGELPNLTISMDTKARINQAQIWQINAHATAALPWLWSASASISQPLDSQSKGAGLYTKLILDAETNGPKSGSISLRVKPGYFQIENSKLLSKIPFEGGLIKGLLSADGLKGTGSIKLDSNKKLALDFLLPDFSLTSGLKPSQSLQANLELVLNSIEFLNNLSPQISNIGGRLKTIVQTRGTLGNPKIQSILSLENAKLTIPQIGLELEPIRCTLKAEKNKWSLTGEVYHSNQKLNLKGDGLINKKLNGVLSLEGQDFPIMHTKEYEINISPKIQLVVNPDLLSLQGSILVPRAQIQPISFSSSLGLSDDIIIKSNKASGTSNIKMDMDLQMRMGDEVRLNVKGLQTKVEGSVQLKKSALSPVLGIGELNVAHGTYKAYGQDLNIDQGVLLFTGGPLNNPGITLKASKKINTQSSNFSGSNQILDFTNNNVQNNYIPSNLVVGVEVSGRLKSPKIQLFSIPASLSQADILSMMVLGRPASQANKAGGQLLLAALSSMNLGTGTSGAQLLDQLKNSLGFDFNIQNSSNYNLLTNQVNERTGVVVGKSLSKRIYLSYNVGLSQADPNVLTLKYILNTFFSIQVSSSDTGNGIDFFYTKTKK